MSVEVSTDIPPAPPPPPPAPPAASPPRRTRLKRLRFVLILLAVLLLGLISFVFGMFVAVASDLPSLTKFSLYKNEQSSTLYDDLGHPIGVLSQQNRVIVTPSQIPPIAKEAVVAIEDKRFWSEGGIDIRGIARAFVNDVFRHGGVQGASTIEEQFIKNALQAQSHRTIFEKLREAALAYQLSDKWSKEKILTAYLNTIYFGNGAYGIESAAQTYFGQEPDHHGCGTPGHEECVQQLQPWEAALLAGIIQDPTAYDPAQHPQAARERRDVVLQQMYQQGYLTKSVYEQSVIQPLPSPAGIQAPQVQPVEGVDVGYFTDWAAQQVIERYGAPRAFDGGLHIKTTLDLGLQRAAERAVEGYLAYSGDPSAALVAIENSTGEVRAMVGGRDYAQSPFNLATEGERQPGSAFKAFDLAAALQDGISPESTWTSKQKEFVVPNTNGREKFVVHNDEGAYVGERTLTNALAYSDNSVFAEVGLKVGTKRIAQLAHEMGITTPISTNPAMTIGGLKVGVTPLDMAHAYETIAHDGQRVSGTLASEPGAPVGVQEVVSPERALPDGKSVDINHVTARRVLQPEIAQTETSMLETVLQYGTARSAALGEFAAGKTGTTSNYVDAWFVGYNHKYTVAVWVGYPEGAKPMLTDFNGTPVLGGTYPALIWHDFLVSALALEKTRAEEAAARAAEHAAGKGHGQTSGTTGTGTGAEEPAPAPSATPAIPATRAPHEEKAERHTSPNTGAGATPGAGNEGAGEHAAPPSTPATPEPTAPQTPATPTPATPEGGGGSKGGGGASAEGTGGVSAAP